MKSKATPLLPFMVEFPSLVQGVAPCLGCPWLGAWQQIHGPDALPTKGILFLQDWGVDDGTETFEAAVCLLTKAISQGAHRVIGSDKTLRALLPNPATGWNRALLEGHWLICNAVWGLRPKGSSKDGTLPDAIHKAAFLLWKDLVLDAAEAANPGQFKLIGAGEWARFAGKEHLVTLSGYLAEWFRWTKANPPPHPLPDGRVIYADHPVAWTRNRKRFDIVANSP